MSSKEINIILDKKKELQNIILKCFNEINNIDIHLKNIYITEFKNFTEELEKPVEETWENI